MARMTNRVDFGLGEDDEILYLNPSDPEGSYTILDLAKRVEIGDGVEAQILLKISKRLCFLEDFIEQNKITLPIMAANGKPIKNDGRDLIYFSR